MNTLQKRLTVIFTAVVLCSSSLYFVEDFIITIPWIIIGLIVGYLSSTHNDTVFNGMIWGYFICLTFYIALCKNEWNWPNIIDVLGFGILFGIAGIIPGIFIAILGNIIRRKVF